MIFILHLGAVASEQIAYNLWYECENLFGKRISFYNILIWQQHRYMIPTHVSVYQYLDMWSSSMTHFF